jgi:hypothetical protein
MCREKYFHSIAERPSGHVVMFPGGLASALCWAGVTQE